MQGLLKGRWQPVYFAFPSQECEIRNGRSFPTTDKEREAERLRRDQVPIIKIPPNTHWPPPTTSASSPCLQVVISFRTQLDPSWWELCVTSRLFVEMFILFTRISQGNWAPHSSQLQCPQFDLELRLLSTWTCACSPCIHVLLLLRFLPGVNLHVHDTGISSRVYSHPH